MERGPRRLAAIVFADVVGFSRMMAEHEDATIAALRAHRNVIDPVVLNHGGRLVKSTGDGFLLEFPTAASAVEASLEVQRLMRERNASIPESRRMEFRIGINLGDIVVDESDDVFGDGVNVAARVEALADPGGIAMSDAVASALRGKLAVALLDHGTHNLKNLPRPVQVWKTAIDQTPSHRPRAVTTARKLATVAVLPFDSLSGEDDQEYFADGITEDLITALSRDRDLAVIARNSTFAFKGSPTDIRNIARELDATHVVEGSVRKSGSRVRITAQLIDAETGHHAWAERYDRDLHDIFAVQDEVVEAIVTRLRPTLWESGRARSPREVTPVDAWDLTMQGLFHANTNSIDGLLKAIEFYEQAREVEPGFVPAVSRSAGAWLMLAMFGWRGTGSHPLERGREDLLLALSLDPHDFLSLCTEAALAGIDGRPHDGVTAARRAIEANPHASFGHHMLGTNLDKSGDQAAAIEALTEAWRLGAHEPLKYDIAMDLGYAHYMEGHYEAAHEWGRQSIRLVDSYLQSRLLMAATCARLGLSEETRAHVASVLQVRPDFSLSRYASRLGYAASEHREALVEGLLQAGLPD
jgi:adenylate cyclase